MNKRKSHAIRKEKVSFTPEEIESLHHLKSLTKFPLSISLLNLLRDPQIINHEFDAKYLEEVEANLRVILDQSSELSNRHHILYLHLVLSQIENLQELEKVFNFDAVIYPINHDTWNSTNIINTNCLLANLRNLNKNLGEEPRGEKIILG